MSYIFQGDGYRFDPLERRVTKDQVIAFAMKKFGFPRGKAESLYEENVKNGDLMPIGEEAATT